MIVIMISFIENRLPQHIIHLAHTIVQRLFVARTNLILVLANAPQVIINPLLDAINHHISRSHC